MRKKLWRHISFSSTCFYYYILITLIRFSRYHLLVASHFHDWFYLGTIQICRNLNECYYHLTSATSVIWQIDANRSPFHSLNMLPFHINFRTLKTNLLGLLSNFPRYYFKKGTICLLFLSSYAFTALEFDSNDCGILLWKKSKATWP